MAKRTDDQEAAYQEGFADAQRDQARIVLSNLADAVELAAQRVRTTTHAISAANEATAILRDAADLSDPTTPDPPEDAADDRAEAQPEAEPPERRRRTTKRNNGRRRR